MSCSATNSITFEFTRSNIAYYRYRFVGPNCNSSKPFWVGTCNVDFIEDGYITNSNIYSKMVVFKYYTGYGLGPSYLGLEFYNINNINNLIDSLNKWVDNNNSSNWNTYNKNDFVKNFSMLELHNNKTNNYLFSSNTNYTFNSFKFKKSYFRYNLIDNCNKFINCDFTGSEILSCDVNHNHENTTNNVNSNRYLDFENCNFNECNFANSSFKYVYYDNCIMKNLSNSSTTTESWYNCMFNNMDVDNSFFTNMTYLYCEFNNMNLTNIIISNTELTTCSFINTITTNVSFDSNTNLTGIKIINSNLSDTNISNIELNNATFENSILNNTNFENSTITDSTFKNTNITGIQLQGATIKNTIFTNAV